MNLKDRIGVDIGRRAKLEDGIAWAAKHGVRYIDIQLDTAANAVTTGTPNALITLGTGGILQSNGISVASNVYIEVKIPLDV